MRRGRAKLVLAPLLALLTAAGQDTSAPVVTSPASSAVAVTVYRDPERDGNDTMNLDWLGGFALVTETRTVRLPAGRATVRFEGVAGGIVPASAIVTGLPGGVSEKNRDARILSATALVDGYLGRRVTLTRTDRASGAVRVQQAVVVAGPAGGVVVRTPDGVEALGCSGLGEATRYAGVPAGLSAQPVLSVETDSRTATTATVTLSYLTSDFDWSAAYVLTVAPDGRTLDLFAWLTLANGNREAFARAQLQAVAGRLNRARTRFEADVAPLRLDCYPLGTTTSTLPPPRQFGESRDAEDIVVTASRAPRMEMAMPVTVIGEARLEELGDLKLYRVPEPATINPAAQKQVALLHRDRVPFERLYRAVLPPAQAIPRRDTAVVLRLRNRVAAGLGLPLPAGTTTLYGVRGGERLLLGTGTLADRAVGETVRISAGASAQVQVEQTVPERGATRIALSNANPFAVAMEIGIDAPVGNIVPTPGIVTVEGRPTWVATVPANGRASLTYRTR